MTPAPMTDSAASNSEPGISVGFLHPGDMGAALARVVRSNGHRVCWVAEGRSVATRQRARASGLEDLGSLEQLCRECSVIISICPPHGALDVARRVAEQAFSGTFIDANAVAPERVRQMAELLLDAREVVDVAVIGPPPSSRSRTHLFLSGTAAERVGRYFLCEGLNVSILGPEIGSASALKMCDSAVNKGLRALLVATLAVADKLNVGSALEELLKNREETAGYMRNRENNNRRAISKSWRFTGEMDAISDTFREMNVPGDFHRGAGEVYRRLSELQYCADTVTMEEMMRVVRQDGSVRAETDNVDD